MKEKHVLCQIQSGIDWLGAGTGFNLQAIFLECVCMRV